MSNLFRKEALDHRSRALYGEVVLRAPLGSWIITALLIGLIAILCAALFWLQVPIDTDTDTGAGAEVGTVSLFEWLASGGQ